MPSQPNTPLDPILTEQLSRLIHSQNDANAWASMGDFLYEQGNGYSLDIGESGARTFGVNALTSTLCYKKAIALNPQASDYWWRLGKACPANGSISVVGESYDERQCYIKSLMLNKKNAMAWCRLGSTMKADESINFYLGQNKLSYSRQTCFVTSIGMESENPNIWFFVASVMTDTETFSLAGEQYNRITCYSRLLELKDLDPSIQTKAWLALNTLLGKDQSCCIAGVTYSKDECAFKALICDNTTTLSIQAPGMRFAPNLPPAASASNFAPAAIAPNLPPAASASNFAPAAIAPNLPPAASAGNAKSSPNSLVKMLYPFKKPIRQINDERINNNFVEYGVVFIGWFPSPHTDGSGRRHCLTCAKELSPHCSWADHILSESHLSAIDEKAKPVTGDESRLQPHYCCIICHSVISGNKNASLHIEGLRHKRRAELMKVCPCCEYIYCSQDENFAHKEYICGMRQESQQQTTQMYHRGNNPLSNPSALAVTLQPQSVAPSQGAVSSNAGSSSRASAASGNPMHNFTFLEPFLSQRDPAQRSVSSSVSSNAAILSGISATSDNPTRPMTFLLQRHPSQGSASTIAESTSRVSATNANPERVGIPVTPETEQERLPEADVQTRPARPGDTFQ